MEAFDPGLEDYFELFSPIRDPLMEELHETKEGILYELYRFDADEMWTGPPGGFVQNKGNKQWIWLVMNTASRQIIACHVGGRGQPDARKLFDQIPELLKTDAVFFADFWNGNHVLDSEKHRASGKGYTNHTERFNNKLRQRCSRLVRKTLSFSRN